MPLHCPHVNVYVLKHGIAMQAVTTDAHHQLWSRVAVADGSLSTTRSAHADVCSLLSTRSHPMPHTCIRRPVATIDVKLTGGSSSTPFAFDLVDRWVEMHTGPL